MTTTETTAPATELTVSEAAAAHEIPLRSLHQAIRRGQVGARKVGPIYLVDGEAARLYGAIHAARRALDAYNGTADAEAIA